MTTPASRIGIIVASSGLLLAVLLWSGGRWEPSSVAATGRASRVLIVGMPGLAWDEVGTGRLPNLDRLIANGALGAMTVRTLSQRPTTVEAYASLGAGTRVRAGGAGAEAAGLSGGPIDVAGTDLLRRDAGRFVASPPGALGAALHAAGLRTAIVGNADTDTAPMRGGLPVARVPAAAALMDADGKVDAGAVDRSLLMADPTAPFRQRADPARVLVAAQAALAGADVVLVDPGDLDRAADVGAAGAHARDEALVRVDQLLGELVGNAPPATLVLVVSVVPPSVEWRLTPVVASGAGVVHGYLYSPSTRRLGLVTLTDLAPTVLAALGAQAPGSMVGQVLRYHAGSTDPGRLARLDRDTAFRERIYLGVVLGFIALQVLIYAAVGATTARRARSRWWRTLLRDAALGVAAFPLATLAFRAMAPLVVPMGAPGVSILVLADLAIVAAVRRARRSWLAPLSWIYGLTAWALLIDIATGGRLQIGGILGYSPQTSGRFFGLGNTAFAVLAATALVGSALHLEHAQRRREALVAVGAFLALVVIVDGAPNLGGDVGGILTLVPVFGITAFLFTGRRLSWRLVAVAATAAIGGLATATAVDLQRPLDARTHLGRVVANTWRNGPHELLTTLAARADADTRLLRLSPWSWAIPIIAALLLWELVVRHRWTESLARASALRIGVVAALAAAVIGFALNDSGVVVIAMVLVEVGPLLAMLTVQLRWEGDTLSTNPG